MFFSRSIAVVAFAFATSSAFAADLPVLKGTLPPLLPPAEYDWTGVYIGVNGGGGLDHFAFPYSMALPNGLEQGTTGITSSGPVFGGQIGFNYQLNNLPVIGHAVVGVEADTDWASLHGAVTVPTLASGPATFSTRFENFGTLRARVGYNFDRLLLYLTGGLTYGTTQNSFSVAQFSGSRTTTFTGLPFRVDAVGAGAEYALTNNISVKAEYMYDCIRANQVTFTPDGTTINFNSRSMYHIIRFGLNYKLDWLSPAAPVVAKY
jgi:outer membrane immunogenic protein